MPITPFKDELLYSIAVRQHLISPDKNWRSSIKSIFGNNCYRVASLLPNHLGNASNNLSIPVKKLIHNHTAFPYFTTFTEKNKSDQLYKSLITSNRVSFMFSFGINKGHTSEKRFCSACIKEDISKHGVSYWHRQHHLPFMTCCTKHMLNLINISLSAPDIDHHSSRIHLPIDFNSKIITTNNTDNILGNAEINFAKISNQMMKT